MFNLEIIDDIKDECKSRKSCANCPYDSNLNDVFGLCDYIHDKSNKTPMKLKKHEIFNIIRDKSKAEMVYELEHEWGLS